jgi:hypothetical protein
MVPKAQFPRCLVGLNEAAFVRSFNEALQQIPAALSR